MRRTRILGAALALLTVLSLAAPTVKAIAFTEFDNIVSQILNGQEDEITDHNADGRGDIADAQRWRHLQEIGAPSRLRITLHRDVLVVGREDVGVIDVLDIRGRLANPGLPGQGTDPVNVTLIATVSGQATPETDEFTISSPSGATFPLFPAAPGVVTLSAMGEDLLNASLVSFEIVMGGDLIGDVDLFDGSMTFEANFEDLDIEIIESTLGHPIYFADPGTPSVFVFEDLPPGTHTLRVEPAPGLTTPDGRQYETMCVEVEIFSDQVTDVGTILLGPIAGSGQVSGQVLLPDGSPVADAQVRAFFDDQDPCLSRPLAETFSDAAGDYLLEGLPAGNLRIFAEELITPPFSDTNGRGNLITLAKGASVSAVDLVLHPETDLTATVPADYLQTGGRPVFQWTAEIPSPEFTYSVVLFDRFDDAIWFRQGIVGTSILYDGPPLPESMPYFWDVFGFTTDGQRDAGTGSRFGEPLPIFIVEGPAEPFARLQFDPGQMFYTGFPFPNNDLLFLEIVDADGRLITPGIPDSPIKQDVSVTIAAIDNAEFGGGGTTDDLLLEATGGVRNVNPRVLGLGVATFNATSPLTAPSGPTQFEVLELNSLTGQLLFDNGVTVIPVSDEIAGDVQIELRNARGDLGYQSGVRPAGNTFEYYVITENPVHLSARYRSASGEEWRSDCLELTVPPAGAVTGADLTLVQVQDLGRISGTVTPGFASPPIDSFNYSLIPFPEDPCNPYIRFGQLDLSTGAYELDGVPPGTYTFRASAQISPPPGGDRRLFDTGSPIEVTVDPGQSVTLNATLTEILQLPPIHPVDWERVSGPLTLEWTAPPSGDFTYTVTIFATGFDPGFDIEGVTGSSLTIPDPSLERNRRYGWTIEGFSSDGSTTAILPLGFDPPEPRFIYE
jgi:hypothetical protein